MIKSCKICNEEFETQRADRIFCGNKCKQKQYDRQSPARQIALINASNKEREREKLKHKETLSVEDKILFDKCQKGDFSLHDIAFIKKLSDLISLRCHVEYLDYYVTKKKDRNISLISKQLFIHFNRFQRLMRSIKQETETLRKLGFDLYHLVTSDEFKSLPQDYPYRIYALNLTETLQHLFKSVKHQAEFYCYLGEDEKILLKANLLELGSICTLDE